MHTEKNQILINATHAGEIRVALLEANKLSDLDIEYTGHEQKKSNVYKGKISRIEPSLEAAFIDYGAERHGFLPFKEIAPSYCKFHDNDLQAIKSSLRVGQEVMVQIEKEERGNKGAALTTYITLAGSYLVLMPNNPGSGGVSRRIEGDERRAMQDLLSQLSISADMGLILRTAGVGRDLNELKNDLNLLLQQWDTIQKAFNIRPAPFLIFQESDLVTRSIRDYLRRDIDEIIIDDKEIYEKTKQYVAKIRPDFVSRITSYQNQTPLFLHFDIEEAAESAFQREVRLASGGTIVIDRAEALVAIDINSGRSTKNGDIEETAVKTNLEAAKEIAHQLRMRDLGGLIVIDFIDMSSEDNKRKVENCLREKTKKDRARIQIGRISAFGLLEMSRQRLRHSLGKANETLCTHCSGQGTVRSIESLTLSLLRLIEKEALKKSARQIRIEASVPIATYLMNEKRASIIQIEQRYQASLLLIPNPYWHTSQYKITTITKHVGADSGIDQGDHSASYQALEDKSHLDISVPYATALSHPAEVPAVQSLTASTSKNKSKTRLGILGRLFSTLTDLNKPKQSLSTVHQADQKIEPHPVVTPYAERRHAGRTTRNNRTRPRGDREQHSRRYSRGPTSYAEQTQTKSFSPDRRPSQTRKKLPENTTDDIRPLRKQEFRQTDKKSVYSSEKQTIPETTTITTLPPIAHQQETTVYQAEPSSTSTTHRGATTPRATARSRTSSPPLQRRNNTRRFGGEPKLRRRHYCQDDQDTEKNG